MIATDHESLQVWGTHVVKVLGSGVHEPEQCQLTRDCLCEKGCRLGWSIREIRTALVLWWSC